MPNTPPDFEYLGGTRMEWVEMARKEQLPPETSDWTTWLYLAGRGAGKTRSCAEWLAWRAIEEPGRRCAIIARTYGDARDTCAEGESGILAILRRYRMEGNYNRSIGEIVLPNKSRIKLFSAEEPDRLRGPQHEFIWMDELAAWQYPDTWDQAQFGLRLGEHPQIAVATTPRPTPLLRRIMADPYTHITRGTTFDNLKNLAPTVATAIARNQRGRRHRLRTVTSSISPARQRPASSVRLPNSPGTTSTLRRSFDGDTKRTRTTRHCLRMAMVWKRRGTIAQ